MNDILDFWRLVHDICNILHDDIFESSLQFKCAVELCANELPMRISDAIIFKFCKHPDITRIDDAVSEFDDISSMFYGSREAYREASKIFPQNTFVTDRLALLEQCLTIMESKAFEIEFDKAVASMSEITL